MFIFQIEVEMKPKNIQEQKWMIHHFLFLHVFQLSCSGWLKLVSFVSYLKSEHIVFLLSATMSIKHVGLCLFLCFMWEKFYVRSFCGTSVTSSRIFTLKHVSKPCLSFCGSYLSVTLNTQSVWALLSVKYTQNKVQRQITQFMNKWSKWISVSLQMTSVTAATDMKWCRITVSKTESFFFFHCCSLL